VVHENHRGDSVINFLKASVASLFNLAGYTFLLFAIPLGLWCFVIAIGSLVFGAFKLAGYLSIVVGIAALTCVVAGILMLAGYYLVRKQQAWVLVLIFVTPIPFAVGVYFKVDTMDFYNAVTGGRFGGKPTFPIEQTN